MATSPINLASMFMTNLESAKSKNSTTAKTTGGTSSNSASSGSGLDSTSTGTTFLSLLVKELQNQDPTSPMDSTAMVGQMISLNSLDQLISINQTLSTATGTGSTTTTTTGKSASATNSAAEVAARTALLGGTQSASAIQNATQAALDPTKALDLSTLNIANGGK